MSDRTGSAAGAAPRERLPWHVRVFSRILKALLAVGIPLGNWFIRAVDGVDLRDPVAGANGRAVFELHALPTGRGN